MDNTTLYRGSLASIYLRREYRAGTVCVRGPCALCQSNFDLEGGAEATVAYAPGDHKLGGVCPQCAQLDPQELRERLLKRAGHLTGRALRLKSLARAEISTQGVLREEPSLPSATNAAPDPDTGPVEIAATGSRRTM